MQMGQCLNSLWPARFDFDTISLPIHVPKSLSWLEDKTIVDTHSNSLSF